MKDNKDKKIFVICATIILLASIAFTVYQNQQLRGMIDVLEDTKIIAYNKGVSDSLYELTTSRQTPVIYNGTYVFWSYEEVCYYLNIEAREE